MEDESVYILGVDFGSTSLTVKIYDEKADAVAASSVKVVFLWVIMYKTRVFYNIRKIKIEEFETTVQSFFLFIHRNSAE